MKNFFVTENTFCCSAKYARSLVKRFGLDNVAHARTIMAANARTPMAANAKLTCIFFEHKFELDQVS